MLHGQLDEEAEAVAFQEAVAAWRNAGGFVHWRDASVDRSSFFPSKNAEVRGNRDGGIGTICFFESEKWKAAVAKERKGQF